MNSVGPLITAGELAGVIDNPQWRIIDVRHRLQDKDFGRAAYAAGHIPGALFLHCDDDLSGVMNGLNGRHPLPDPSVLAKRLGDCGIGPETSVVVYDDAEGMFACRLWWLLRWLGHDRVVVLDGGLNAWLAAGLPLSETVPAYAALEFIAQPALTVRTADQVLAILGDPHWCIVDARSPDRFRGENETMDSAGGHIPGAVNRFFRDNLQADGCFKSAAVLRQEWLVLLDGHGPETVIHQCGSGVTACHNLLALERAGLSGGTLYAGSWSEWSADPSRPVAVG